MRGIMLVDGNKMSIIKILNEIEKDCLRLRRNGMLTEYGEGQLELIKFIKKKIK